MSVARRDLKEAGGESRPRQTGTGYKAKDRGVSRHRTVKPESYPDAAGVNPAGGDCGKETGLTLGGLWACPVDPDYSVSDDDGWARRSQQTP